MVFDERPQSSIFGENHQNRKAGCLFTLLTDRRPVSRRNRASWLLRQLNKLISVESAEKHATPKARKKNVVSSKQRASPLGLEHFDDPDERDEDGDNENDIDEDEDIRLIAVSSDPHYIADDSSSSQQYMVTPETSAFYLARCVATSIILDLSPSVVSVSSQNDCIFLESIFDALKRFLQLLIRKHELPGSSSDKSFLLEPRVHVTVIAYTPFILAKNNQVLVQNRRISSLNLDQVLVELWLCLTKLIQETHELVSNTCGSNIDFDSTRRSNQSFMLTQPPGASVIRHPGTVLEDIFELGLFSCSIMPKLSRLSILIITDGLFSSTNNLDVFRIKSIAVSFICLGSETTQPDSNFGYISYVDLMRFIAKTTLGVYLTYQDLIDSTSQEQLRSRSYPLLLDPIHKLFGYTLHSDLGVNIISQVSPHTSLSQCGLDNEAKYFYIDQPNLLYDSFRKEKDSSAFSWSNDWRFSKELAKNLEADFEQVLACLLREGYLIKSIQFKHKDSPRIVARLVLHWRYNLDLEQELTAPYWGTTDPFDINDSKRLILRPFNAPPYGDTYCEIFVHGSYSFLHNFYCNNRSKRRSEYRDIAYRQFKQLIDGVLQTQERILYLSRFYRDSSLSRVPSFLLHGNSLLYEQPHTHRLTATIENVTYETKTSEFQEYWQKISCLDTKSWKNLMHIHTLRLVLEHDQPKHKNIHYQNANGRYTHVQCRRALTAISNFIKNYASFALLEDSTYVKFIYNVDDDLREIETSSTKGFVVIRINKLLPIIVINLMFTSGILDSHRFQIVSYLENQLLNCKLRSAKSSTSQSNNILRSKTISPSSESCCVIIKSPLERMLKVYSRNYISDFLINNWSQGLPGSCPYRLQQYRKLTSVASEENHSDQKSAKNGSNKPNPDGYVSDESAERYNLIFGKYLYGVRVVQTISDLPHDMISFLAANVLSKISAILVNLRIKQGFHIAFNNSGILNLVVELSMQDHSHAELTSGCLCQYVVFPPTIINGPQITSNGSTSTILNKQSTLCGSYKQPESFPSTCPDVSQSSRIISSEVKVIKEYWIEQQYGSSSKTSSYHESLHGMRYPEVVDHLFLSDSSIFECLLTYNLLQLICDRLSPFYELDSTLTSHELRSENLISPTLSTDSSIHIDSCTNPIADLPSNLIEGNTRDGHPKVPIIEQNFKFSIVQFLEDCQLASLNVLLFQNSSDFYEAELDLSENYLCEQLISSDIQSIGLTQRKLSIDGKDFDICEIKRREHRRSMQQEPTLPARRFHNVNLNQIFLDTLLKRLKQMHDNELKLSLHDKCKLPIYLKQRITTTMSAQNNDMEVVNSENFDSGGPVAGNQSLGGESSASDSSERDQVDIDEAIEWRCFLRKGNQENLMIVLIPITIDGIVRWSNFIHDTTNSLRNRSLNNPDYATICPMFVFRCSSSMINDHVMSFLERDERLETYESYLESDMYLHFGQPCKYLGQLRVYNDELSNEISHLLNCDITSDEKTLEIVHFRAFLRKIKNTVLKSRFSALNDAYLSEIFIHKDDILYYINNVDSDTQKKYHVSAQLKSLADFIKSYEEYNNSLPKNEAKPCDQLLNSILLQKCGLFLNQPLVRFNESNPLMRQLHDRKLLSMMRWNYKVELPILEENLSESRLLRGFIRTSAASNSMYSSNSPAVALSSSVNEGSLANNNSMTTSSLSKIEGSKLMEMKCGSVGSSATNGTSVGSPSASFATPTERSRSTQAPRFSSVSQLNSLPYLNSADGVILEAFRGIKCCAMKEVKALVEGEEVYENVSLRHEAHMADVLRRTGERKESHHYRRVLKSKGNYNQSYSAIAQALKRVDSLGRLEHFCLTPLLFSPSWRTKLAPVRDHTIELDKVSMSAAGGLGKNPDNQSVSDLQSNGNDTLISDDNLSQHVVNLGSQQEAEDRWHQLICNNYIKEYEQYIQTLGFNSVQIRHPSSSKVSSNQQAASTGTNLTGKLPAAASVSSTSRLANQKPADSSFGSNSNYTTQGVSGSSSSIHLRRCSVLASTSSLQTASAVSSAQSTSNTGYLIKFLNSGCLVFKVGLCKPYVYSILYSIEGERFNNSNTRVNMVAFLDELDNIKATMHLHSFTYDYHLRSMYSYISGRQMTFSPGYHLISFLDDFRKYYQKAPNYARNHILCGEVNISDIKVNGQQLYNYIVTHNSIYHLDVLEMSSFVSGLMLSAGRAFINSTRQEELSELDVSVRSHANDYVLVELKREKIRHRDGKDPDIYDYGLLITHDGHQTNLARNSLTLKYFLVLTNQRDLYPKLMHNYGNVISSGCHRPIRLGLSQVKQRRGANDEESSPPVAAAAMAQTSESEDVQSSLELQSSDEVSAGQSTISTANSMHSSSSGLRFAGSTSTATVSSYSTTNLALADQPTAREALELTPPRASTTSVSLRAEQEALELRGSSAVETSQAEVSSPDVVKQVARQSNESCSSVAHTSKNATAGPGKPGLAERAAICDEEITYLGYFSTDEMDMLRFLQDKTANLKAHIDEIVRQAEVHYRRDYLWQKLMQRPAACMAPKPVDSDLPITVDELIQLLAIVESLDLANLDPQLMVFTSVHINWHIKLIKAFADLKQQSSGSATASQHRIYSVRASKLLLIYIDPNCTSAFILLSVDTDKSCIELNMMLKDRQESGTCKQFGSDQPASADSPAPANDQESLGGTANLAEAKLAELDQDCQQLINDFINFCAAFMWSTFLT